MADGEFRIDPPVQTGRAAVTAALAGGTFGQAISLVLPAFVGVLGKDYGLDEAQLGFISSADLAGLTVGAALGAKLFPKLGLKQTAWLGIAIALAANLASVAVRGYWPLLSMRFFAGAGGGVLVAICYVVLGKSRQPDRNFSIFVICQGVFGAIGIRSMPWLSGQAGAAGVFVILAVLMAFTMLLAFLLPGQPLRDETPAYERRQVRFAGRLALGATCLFFISQGALWTYVQIIGTRGGVTVDAAASGLALASLVSLGSMFVAAALGQAIGRTVPLAFGTALLLAGSIVLGLPLDATRFALAACLLAVGWNISIPYQLATLAAADETGRMVGLAAPVSLAGLAAGPAIAALVLGTFDLSALLWLNGGLCVVGFAGLIPALVAGASRASVIDVARPGRT